MKKRLLIALLLSATLTGVAQEQQVPKKVLGEWTLQACIDLAKEQNLSIQRNRLDTQSARIDQKMARANRLPTVSFSTNQSVANRPFNKSSAMINGSDVITTTSKTSYSGSYGVSAQMPIYDGGEITNNIKLQEINTQIADLNLAASELTIEENITQLYVQIMYAMEAIETDKLQIELSAKQVERGNALFKAGLLNRADVAQLEAQAANDRYQLVADQTSLSEYKLQMKQLLELDGDEAFEILVPELKADYFSTLPAKNDVYQAALLSRPEIRAQELAMDKSDLDVKIAKAGMLPTVSLSAGINTSNVTGAGNMFTQLKNQWNNMLGVNVSVPIFDHSKTKNAVAKARLNKESARLSLLDTQKNLWKTIETYWLNAYSAQQRYAAAQEKVRAAEASYELTSEQFRLGLKNIVELLTDKTNVSTANQQMLQAKYMAVLNKAMLEYYGR